MLDTKVLGQLVLMQTILISLPDSKSIFSFACRGLEDIPGVTKVNYIFMSPEILRENIVNFKLSKANVDYGHIQLTINDADSYKPYDEYIRNFVFIIEIILEERRQQELNRSYKLELEQKVEERTKQFIESSRKYQGIFNATSDAIIIHDIGNGTIYDVNEAMLLMFGYDKDEIISKTPDFLSSGISPYDKNGVIKKIQNTVDYGPQIFEWQAKKRNGDLFWIEINLKYTNILGKKLIISAIRDITLRKKNQEMLIQNEKMISVGGLAAGVAHEINNPLSAITITANILNKRLCNGNDISANIKAAQKLGLSYDVIKSYMEERNIDHLLDTILESSSKIADIVANTLDFSRKSTDTFVMCSISKILDKAMDLASTGYDLKKHYDFKSIEIVKDYQDDLPLINAEPTKIQQVFINILINGAHSMCASGKDSLKFILRLNHLVEEQMVEIQIEDNGQGMNEATRKRIFEPFFTTKKSGEGTGLGLSVSSFIINNEHNGQIFVESIPGKGSKFQIKLPIK